MSQPKQNTQVPNNNNTNESVATQSVLNEAVRPTVKKPVQPPAAHTVSNLSVTYKYKEANWKRCLTVCAKLRALSAYVTEQDFKTRLNKRDYLLYIIEKGVDAELKRLGITDEYIKANCDKDLLTALEWRAS